MPKAFHELRDPIHTFVRFDSYERDVINSEPFQRLRHIHQLSTTFLLYPGATHKRFEHSLGVMDLASRVYDVITDPLNVQSIFKDVFHQIYNQPELTYWKRVLRMAALCHDLGHPPFSHAAEKDLFPLGHNHELMTVELIKGDMMRPIWESMTPPLRPDDIAKIAVGPKVLREIKFTDWEALLSEIIVGDSFGVDRIDYLLRDSHHAGVMYGKFDHHRLIDTLRILPKSYEEGSMEATLGIEDGGLHAAEALLLARYFMFVQVYLHHVRRIYDKHLTDFLREWLSGGKFDVAPNDFLKLTDNEAMAAILKASKDANEKGHAAGKRIACREHFKVLYDRVPGDLLLHPRPGEKIAKAAADTFGTELIRHDFYSKGGGGTDFPVLLCGDGSICSSHSTSTTLKEIPDAIIDFVFIEPTKRDKAKKWLISNKKALVSG